MANGEDHGATVETWRAGGLSAPHLVLGFSVLACLAMAVVTLGL